MSTTTTTPYEVVTANGEPIRSNTLEWLRARASLGIGASEAPAIIGMAPWMSPRDVQLAKLSDVITDDMTEAMEFGHLMEPVARTLFERRHGDPDSERHAYLGKLKPAPGLIRSLEHPHLLASLDALIEEPDGAEVPGQIKNVTVFRKGSWSEAEGGVPDYVRVQVIQEAVVLGVDHGWVLPIFGGNHMPEPIRVDADSEFVDWYLEFSTDWWQRYIVEKVEVPPTLLDDLSSIWSGTPGLAVDLPPELVKIAAEHRRRKDALTLEATAIDELALQVKTYMGDATEAYDRSGHPERLVATWRPNRESAPKLELDVEQLKTDHPELVDLLDGYTHEVPGRKPARPFLSK